MYAPVSVASKCTVSEMNESVNSGSDGKSAITAPPLLTLSSKIAHLKHACPRGASTEHSKIALVFYVITSIRPHAMLFLALSKAYML